VKALAGIWRAGRQRARQVDAALILLSMGVGLGAIFSLGWQTSQIFVILPAVIVLAAAIALKDIASLTIPDRLNLAFFAIAALSRLIELRLADVTLFEGLKAVGLDLALSAGLLWVIREVYFRLRGYDGLGLGDVKLAAGGGLLLGATGFAFALLVASVLGLFAVVVSRLVKGPRRMKEAEAQPHPITALKLPFGALLAPCFALCFAFALFQSGAS
jgi:prepilin signal peptidase PulO-like enzyme (type II secretory pathway)